MAAPRLRKFVQRAPRYLLRTDDTVLMRFGFQSLNRGPSSTEEALLYNLSETGVAFLLSNSPNIKLNDEIKVELPVPNGEQIAWWARVVRIEEIEIRNWLPSKNPFRVHSKILVACKFEDLPIGHTYAIRSGIRNSFLRAMRDQKYINFYYFRTWFLRFGPRLFTYILLAVMAFTFLYLISRPSGNYDAKRGAPWGQRFKAKSENQ